MRGRRSILRIQMDDSTRTILQSWLHRQKTPHGLVRRARAMLLLEQGQTYLQTAERVSLAECHVRKWARRFCEQGIAGLSEKPREGSCSKFFS
jgi:transposase